MRSCLTTYEGTGSCRLCAIANNMEKPLPPEGRLVGEGLVAGINRSLLRNDLDPEASVIMLNE